MENDANVRKLVKLISTSYDANLYEMVATDLSYPAIFRTEEFLRKLQDVLFTKQILMRLRWKVFLDKFMFNMLSSHEMYVRHVMFACLSEDKVSFNILDRFLTVCGVVIGFCVETNKRTGVNLCDLNFDIIMMFYEYVLRRVFYRRGSFHRLAEYIRDHIFLKWSWPKKDSLPSDDLVVVEGIIQKGLAVEFQKELAAVEFKPDFIESLEVESDEFCLAYAWSVLSVTTAELQVLPTSDELAAKMHALSQEKMAISAEEETTKSKSAEELPILETTLQQCPDSNSGSKTTKMVNQKQDETWCEHIVQASARCNILTKSGQLNLRNQNQKEAAEILMHLKNTIKYFIEVLDQKDEEC